MIDLDPVPPYESAALLARLYQGARAMGETPAAAEQKYGQAAAALVYGGLTVHTNQAEPQLSSLLYPFFRSPLTQPTSGAAWIPDQQFGFGTYGPGKFANDAITCEIRNVASFPAWFSPPYTGNVMALRAFAIYAVQALMKYAKATGVSFDQALLTALLGGFSPPPGWTFALGQEPDEFSYGGDIVRISEVAWSREMLRLYTGTVANFTANETSMYDAMQRPPEDGPSAPLKLTVPPQGAGCATLELSTFQLFHGTVTVFAPQDLGKLLHFALTSLGKATATVADVVKGGGEGGGIDITDAITDAIAAAAKSKGKGGLNPATWDIVGTFGQTAAQRAAQEAVDEALKQAQMATDAYKKDPSNPELQAAAQATAAAYYAAVAYQKHPGPLAAAAMRDAQKKAKAALIAAGLPTGGQQGQQMGDACTTKDGQEGKITGGGAPGTEICMVQPKAGMGTGTKVAIGVGVAGALGLTAWKLGWLKKLRGR